MYNKKYRLTDIKSQKWNPLHDRLINKVCYLAYLNVGERGWFLYDTQEPMDPVHRICTSVIKNVKYTRSNQVIVITENTKYTFDLILQG